MAMVSIDNFLKFVTPYCPDVMELAAQNAILSACIEFCQRTTIHRIDMTAISSVDGTASYTITVPADTQLAEIVQLSYSGIPIKSKSLEELETLLPYQDWTDVEGQPAFYTQLTPGEVTLVPIPTENAASALTGRIALMPTRSATTVYDDLYNRYAEEIALGATSRLYYTPGQPYYNPKMAETCKAKFESAIAKVRARANKGQGRGMLRVMTNRF